MPKTGATGTPDYWERTDVILPTQLRADVHALGAPEHRLRLAVLEDAVHQLQRHAHATGRRERARFEVELDWFASDDHTEPFAFESICDALDLDPEFVRERLRRWRDGAGLRVARSPRRVTSGRTLSVSRRPVRRPGHVA